MLFVTRVLFVYVCICNVKMSVRTAVAERRKKKRIAKKDPVYDNKSARSLLHSRTHSEGLRRAEKR